MNTLQDLYNNNFKMTRPFDMFVRDKGHNTDAVQIKNDYLDEFKKYGIEVHYEIQYREENKDNLIRLDCHAFPYGRFKNSNSAYVDALRGYYSDEQTQRILNMRKILFDHFNELKNISVNKDEYRARFDIDYIWLRRRYLEDRQYCYVELLSETFKFIAETYPDLVNALEKCKQA